MDAKQKVNETLPLCFVLFSLYTHTESHTPKGTLLLGYFCPKFGLGF